MVAKVLGYHGNRNCNIISVHPILQRESLVFTDIKEDHGVTPWKDI